MDGTLSTTAAPGKPSHGVTPCEPIPLRVVMEAIVARFDRHRITPQSWSERD